MPPDTFDVGPVLSVIDQVLTDGVSTMYAHLATISVGFRQVVPGGYRLGTVGATGDATGPHLHFEVRVRGASVDPLPALP